ncbi:MAG: PEP-CTERM sorting domain-containing protein [Phycisphaerales bacterium]|nr:PEP-CTERM sorting domain-containing protein [Phycisphaerales bacterium]
MRITHIATISALCGAAFTAQADFTTTWDSGTFEGWTSSPSPAAGNWDVFPTGGNPDGYVSYFDGPDGSTNPVFLFAPGQYLGDYTGFGPGAGFSYDAIWESDDFDPILPPVIHLFGANGEEAIGFGAGVNSTGWDSFFIALEESSWDVVSGNWNDLLQNVTAVGISGDNGIGPDREAGVDNFTLIVPAPASLTLLGLGAAFASSRRR